jgi:hypothetical protein
VSSTADGEEKICTFGEGVQRVMRAARAVHAEKRSLDRKTRRS